MEKDRIGQDFLEALQRLTVGVPRNDDLRSKKERGTLKITLTAVATEAGHSRTLIAQKRSRFSEVRAAVRRHKIKNGRTKPASQTIRELRQEKAELEQKVALAFSIGVAQLRKTESDRRSAELAPSIPLSKK